MSDVLVGAGLCGLVPALFVWGFAPRTALHLILKLWPAASETAQALRGDFEDVPLRERPFWVFDKLSMGLLEGLAERRVERRARSARSDGLVLRMGNFRLTLKKNAVRGSGKWPIGAEAERQIIGAADLVPESATRSTDDSNRIFSRCL